MNRRKFLGWVGGVCSFLGFGKLLNASQPIVQTFAEPIDKAVGLKIMPELPAGFIWTFQSLKSEFVLDENFNTKHKMEIHAEAIQIRKERPNSSEMRGFRCRCMTPKPCRIVGKSYRITPTHFETNLYFPRVRWSAVLQEN